MPLRFQSLSPKGLAPAWLKSLVVRHWPLAFVTFSLWMKLELMHQTLGARVGQVSVGDYLSFAWDGLTEGMPGLVLMGGYVLNLCSVLLVTAWTVLLRGRARWSALLAIDIVLTTLIVGDCFYFRYFHQLLSPVTLLQIGMVPAVEGVIATLVHPSDLLFFVDLVPLLVLTFKPFPEPPPARRAWVKRSIAVAVLVTLGWLGMSAGIEHGNRQRRNSLNSRWSDGELYQANGLLPFHVLSAAKYLSERYETRPPTAAEFDRLAGYLAAHQAQREAPAELTGIARGKNLVIVQVEAFQNFVIDLRLGGKEITPHLNQLARESLYFPDFFQQTGPGRTSDAELAANCSLLFLRAGSPYVRFPHQSYDCISTILRDRGYTTLAFNGFEPQMYARDEVYRALGYQSFFSIGDFKVERTLGWGLGDRSLFRQSLDKLAQARSPFLAYFITLSSHSPFNVSQEIPHHFDGDLPPGVMADYVETIRYVDEAIGILVDGLKARGLWEDTVLVVFGDHDNGIRDPEQYRALLGHPLSTFDQAVLPYRVGLMVHLPGNALAAVHPEPVGQTDLPPTLLRLLGVQGEDPIWMGSDLFSPQHHLLPIAGPGFVSREHLLAMSPDHGAPRCFALGTGALLPEGACTKEFREALESLEVSRTVVVRGLVPALHARKRANRVQPAPLR